MKLNDLSARLDPIFQGKRPGAALGVFHRGKAIYLQGYGLANVESRQKVDALTLFNLGSVSKHFTAYLIYRLQQQGRLSLDDRLLRYFPELPKLFRPITLRQLIQHRSGMRCIDSPLIIEGFAGRWSCAPKDKLRLLKRQTELNFKPGTSWNYCNSGYFLLGQLVERRSGMSLPEFARQEIFKPLGMARTKILETHQNMPSGAATGYVETFKGLRPALVGPANPGATDVWTCLHDMAAWEANFYSPRASDRGIVQAMQTGGAPCPSSPGSRYSGGLFLWKMNKRRMVGHGGLDSGFGTEYERCLDLGLSVLVMRNSEDIGAAALCQSVFKVLLGKTGAQKAPRPAAKKTSPKVKRRAASALTQGFDGLWQVKADGQFWTLSTIKGGLHVTVFWGGFDIIEERGVLRGQGVAATSTFEFKKRKGLPFQMIEKKKGRVFKTLQFLGKSQSKIPNARDYAGYYYASEAGLYRALMPYQGGLRSYQALSRGPQLKVLGPDYFVAGAGTLLRFERDRSGRARSMLCEDPGGRTRCIRYFRMPASSRPFKLVDESWAREHMDKFLGGLVTRHF